MVPKREKNVKLTLPSLFEDFTIKKIASDAYTHKDIACSLFALLCFPGKIIEAMDFPSVGELLDSYSIVI